MGAIGETNAAINILLKLYKPCKEVLYDLVVKYIKKDSFYVKSFEKNTTIYRNGHGIITSSVLIKIVNEKNFKEYERSIDIGDAKKSTIFPKFNKMKDKDIKCRFDEFAFWYENAEYISKIYQKNSKDKKIDWVFKINKDNIGKRKEIKIVYAFSIPGMSPIKDGKLDVDELPYDNYKFMSAIGVSHPIKKIIFKMNFEKGIDIEDLRFVFCKVDMKNEKLNIEKEETYKKEDSIFYNSYIYNKKSALQLGSKVCCYWNVNKANEVQGGN